MNQENTVASACAATHPKQLSGSSKRMGNGMEGSLQASEASRESVTEVKGALQGVREHARTEG